MYSLRKIFLITIILFFSSTNYADFVSSSCSGRGDKVICMVAGDKKVLYSLDKGQTWEMAPEYLLYWPIDLVEDRNYVSCHESITGNYCFYLGTNYHSSMHPQNDYLYSLIARFDETHNWNLSLSQLGGYLFYKLQCQSNNHCSISGSLPLHSENDGKSWGKIERPIKNAFSCINNKGSFCLAADDAEFPTIFKTYDGIQWQSNVVEQLPSNSNQYKVYATHCSNASNVGLCIAVGEYVDARSRQRPFLATSVDGGNKWTYQLFLSALPQGALLQVNCDKQDVASCIAVGYQFDKRLQRPFIVKTSDHGKTWQEKKIQSDVNLYGDLRALYCGLSHDKFVCSAGGKANDSAASSLFIESEDAGETWSLKLVSGLSNVSINSINCTGSNLPDEVCIATAGSKVMLSLDGRKTWSINKQLN